MSILTKDLLKLGVPKPMLDYVQSIVNKMKALLVGRLPTPAALAERVRGNPQFKAAYRMLSDEGKAAVDKVLLTILTCALASVKKILEI